MTIAAMDARKTTYLNWPPKGKKPVPAGLKPLHLDPTGQVALYQSGDIYWNYLESRFGSRFLEYRRRWRETSERGDSGGFPRRLDLAVNTGCQLSCLMCPLPSRPEARRTALMDEKPYRRLMAQAREHSLPA